MEKHFAGWLLRKSGASYTDIAKILKVSKNTVTAWAHKHDWEDRLIEDQLFNETSTEQVRSMIQYQLKILNAIKDRKHEALGDLKNAELTELNGALISKGDIDALQKLYTTIRGKELAWEQVVKVVRELMEYLESEKFDLAQKVEPFANEFLDNKRKAS